MPTAQVGSSINGAKVRRLRERAGLTREALAVKADISHTLLMRIEQGVAGDVGTSKLKALATILGTTMDDLAA